MIMREIPAGAAWFTVYEACIRMVNPRGIFFFLFVFLFFLLILLQFEISKEIYLKKERKALVMSLICWSVFVLFLDTHHEIVNPNPTTIIFAGSFNISFYFCMNNRHLFCFVNIFRIIGWYCQLVSILSSRHSESRNSNGLHPSLLFSFSLPYLLGSFLIVFQKQTHLRPHSTIHKATHKAKIHSQTFAQVFLSIYRQSGIKGLYRGVHVSMMQGANSTATAFLSYETMSNLLNKLFH